MKPSIVQPLDAPGPAPGERPLLLLLPGLLCDTEVWAGVQPALAPHWRTRVVGYASLNRIDAMARHVLQAADAPRFALAGHSMGGRVALEVMRLAPERVRAVALLDTGAAALAEGSAGQAERSGRMELLHIARSRGMRTMARAWATPMLHPDALETPVFERIVAMIERFDAGRFEAQIQALLQRPDATPQLPAIRCPALLLCGREDRWSPLARHEAMQALIPGSVLRVIEHCGHMSPMEQPGATSQALAEWLQQVALQMQEIQ